MLEFDEFKYLKKDYQTLIDEFGDVEKIQLCKLDELLTFALEKFDTIQKTSPPTAEYFQ